MSQLALRLPAAPPRPSLRAVPRPAPALPRPLRVALSTVSASSPDGRAFAAIARFVELHPEGGGVLPQELRRYARRVGLGQLGGGLR